MRILTTRTRLKVEEIISRLLRGNEVTLQERIELHKYARRIPFISLKLKKALSVRKSLEENDRNF